MYRLQCALCDSLATLRRLGKTQCYVCTACLRESGTAEARDGDIRGILEKVVERVRFWVESDHVRVRDPLINQRARALIEHHDTLTGRRSR